jgi:hypothetical protein
MICGIFGKIILSFFSVDFCEIINTGKYFYLGGVNLSRQTVTNTVDSSLWGKVKKLSKYTKIPASRLLDEAMEDLLNKYGGKK